MVLYFVIGIMSDVEARKLYVERNHSVTDEKNTDMFSYINKYDQSEMKVANLRRDVLSPVRCH